MSGRCLEGVQYVSGRYQDYVWLLEGVWKMSGRCLEGIRRVSRTCRKDVWRIDGGGLEGVWKRTPYLIPTGRKEPMCLEDV